MSLLNITNDGLPNILVQLHAAVLRASKPIPKEDLLDTVAPLSVVEDEGKQARQTLTRWTQLGLFQETDGAIFVSDRPQGRLRSPREMLAFTRRMACARVLAPENNPDFWAAEGALAADLTRGLAWMMVQDIYRTDFSKFEEQESKQIRDSTRCLLKNSTRRPGLQYWARFLGFSQQPFADIDPTVAVRDILPNVLAEGEDMHATGFLDRLAGALPVMDKGIWQEEMIAALDPNALARLRQGQLSTALSRALLNLRESGELQLQRRADVGSSIVLTGVQGIRSDLEFHWIVRPKAGAT